MYTRTGTLNRETYVSQYAPLVKRVAHQMLSKLPANVEVDDLIQAGMIGLMDAVERFEEDHGAKFETFASQRIRGAMLDELRAGDWLPRSVRRNQRTIESAITTLEHRTGRPPTETEIARELSMELAQYHELLSDAKGAQLCNYDEADVGDDSEEFFSRGAGDSSSDPSNLLADKRFKLSLVNAIEALPEREKNLMGLYYEQDLNMKEIAAVMGVTESRVCQLHSQAVARLRGRLKGW
ncbi:MAG: RNA polymerase sigma factor FliA [Burkholderiales bacterium]|nr:RNA polymerase sigma factor FliA [Rhodocyclaceae bacterium]MCA3021788.1 RNA polymerase sigma factor FliA [Rhodocyclaceae bacterium]MCA3044176.1 RNA polymerase sigma factor FliA [Rhodocyclaceae bacterium]MCA3053896.1 RNA polymerase sigma factor FliA [Rhodocyclaceae bacterium]